MNKETRESAYAAAMLDPVVRQLRDYEPMTVHGENKLRQDLRMPMHLIRPRLYLGSVEGAVPRRLQELGITHVVNCLAPEFSCPDGTEGIVVLSLNVEDDDNQPLDFPRVMTFIHAALQHRDHAVFVHCAMGISRSATFVAAFLMQSERHTCAQAVGQLQSIRCQVHPNAGFLAQLRRWERTLGVHTDDYHPPESTDLNATHTSMSRSSGSWCIMC
jgi:hypothetical protein